MEPNEQTLVGAARAAETRHDWGAAARAWREVVLAFPANTDAFLRYAGMMLTGSPEQVYELGEHALRGGGERAAVLVQTGYAALACGRHDDAVRCFERAHAATPEDLGAVLGLADAYLVGGRREDAAALVVPLIDAGGREGPLCVMFSRLAHPLGRAEEAIGLLRPHADDARVRPEMRAQVCFRICDLLDKLGRHDEAFDAAARGNGLIRGRYDPAGFGRQVEGVIAAWTPERVAGLARAEAFTPTPVYVVGMPRSGSSLVESILASHPLIAGLGEVAVVDRVISELLRPGVGIDALNTGAESARLSGLLAEGYRASSGEARHVVDKRLSNFLHLGVLNAIAPHARVVVMRRDPLDTGVSCFMSHFRGGVEFGYDLAHIGHFQKMYDRLTAHWAGVIDLPMFELSYEELVADQRGVTERLLSFVGVGFDEACLRFHEGAHVTRTLSTEQVRRPMYAESVGRAERYGSRLDPLRAALGMPAFGE